MGIDMGKNTSLSGLACRFFGAMLILSGVSLAAMTARGLINYHAVASRHGGDMVDLGAATGPQAGQHGSMVRLVGTPVVVEAPHDPEFNLRVNTPVLVRRVEMFQWREVRIGAGVHYELDWVDHPVDASRFVEPAGHHNPASFPIGSKQFDAGLVRVGGFKLSPRLLHALPGSAQVPPDLMSLPQNLAASFTRYRDDLVTSTHPGDPGLGDLRVSWHEIPLRQMTVVARVDGDQVVAASGAADGRGYDVEIGDVPLLDLFPDLPVPPESALGRHILAVLLAALGAFVLLSCHRSGADLPKPAGFARVALLGLALGALVVGAVASMLWLGNDTQMMFGWLLVALLGMLVAIWRLHRRK